MSTPEMITATISAGIDNPYWDAVKDFVYADRRPWGTEYQVDPFRLPNGEYRHDLAGKSVELIEQCSRNALVKKYAWTISDPVTLQFVVNYCEGHKILDPLAGTGYWAFLLSQFGIDVICSDKDPFNNKYHSGAILHHKIVQQDAVDAVRLNPDRTLLLSWIPYSDPLGSSILNQYNGNRIIYIGENEYGCCADDDFFAKLERGWDEVASHRPIQWFGLHDYVTIYERKAITSGMDTAAVR